MNLRNRLVKEMDRAGLFSAAQSKYFLVFQLEFRVYRSQPTSQLHIGSNRLLRNRYDKNFLPFRVGFRISFSL